MTSEDETDSFQTQQHDDNGDSTKNTTKRMILPIRLISTVVRGFGRGSSDLGIPTANLSREACNTDNFDDLPCGIYWGFCRIGEPQSESPTATTAVTASDDVYLGKVYKTAVSIGYNPTYGNEKKTVEPHLIASATDERRHASSCGETVLIDFYDQPIRLSVVGHLRPELPFEGLDKLIEAIKKDICDAERLCDSTDDITLEENAWVASS
jgi:riboflavin kinase